MLQFHKILLQNQNVCEMAKFTLHIYTLILPAIILKIVSQSCLGQPLAIWLAKGALRDKSLKETIFKISAQ